MRSSTESRDCGRDSGLEPSLGMQRVRPPHTAIAAQAHDGNQRSVFRKDADPLVAIRPTAHLQLEHFGVQRHASGAGVQRDRVGERCGNKLITAGRGLEWRPMPVGNDQEHWLARSNLQSGKRMRRAGDLAVARPFRSGSRRHAKKPDRAVGGTPRSASTSSLPTRQPPLAKEPSHCPWTLPDALRRPLPTTACCHEHAFKVGASASNRNRAPVYAAFLQKKHTCRLS